MRISNFFIKPLLALAVALPVATTLQVGEADARHKRSAVIAGVILGGAIAYHQYRKHKKYRHRGSVRYGRSYGRSYHRSHRHRHFSRRHYHRGYYHRH